MAPPRIRHPVSTLVIPPATRFRRRAMGAAAVAGGLLTAAGFAATVWETAPDKLAYLDSLVVDPLRSQIAAVLLHHGYMGIVPMLLGLAGGLLPLGHGAAGARLGGA